MATLKAEQRNEFGSRKMRRLREKGVVPGIMYGHGEDPVAISLSAHDTDLAIQHGEHWVELELGGQTHNVLFKDAQYDTFGRELMHVDFARVDLNERVEVAVPINFRGTSVGEQNGGVLSQISTEVNIECVVTKIPEEIRVHVDDMEIGDTMYISDLELPEGATLVDDPETPIASVSIVTEEEVEEAEAEEGVEAAEPEVIGAAEEEGEEAEGGEEEE